MDRVDLECKYCGHRWEVIVYSYEQIDEMRCTKCDDSNIKARVKESADIFGYHDQSPRPDAYFKKKR